MSEIQPLQHWWRCIEESVIRGESSPQGLPDAMDPPLVDLAQAAVCEVRMDLDPIADLLKKTVDIREPWDSARILRMVASSRAYNVPALSSLQFCSYLMDEHARLRHSTYF